MSTSCKIIIGWTDHMNEWNTKEVYQRYMDGYPSAILPTIVENIPAKTIAEINNGIEEKAHQFEKVYGIQDGITCTDYYYYIDCSDYGHIKVTVLENDNEYYNKYHLTSFKVEREFGYDGSKLLSY